MNITSLSVPKQDSTTNNMCLSKPKSAFSTQSANIRKANTQYKNQRSYNRRCQTAVSKPHRKMAEACTYHVVRQMELEGHKSALNNAVLVLGIHRSKSEVDVHSVQSDVSQTSSQYLPREHSQILLSPQEILRERRTAGLNREETKIPTTKIPKKGLIKLTSLDHEMQDPTYYDKHKEESEDEGWMRRKPLGHISDPHKTFTKKTMLSHIKEGTRMLAEEEKIHQEQEEIEKQLGEYTFGDLHKNLEDITHSIAKKNSEEMIKSVTRKQKPTVNKPMIYGSQNKTRQQPVERSVTLPSIKDFSFG